MEQKILENIIKTALEQKVSSKEEIIKIERQFCDEKNYLVAPFYLLNQTYQRLLKQHKIQANPQLETLLRKAQIRSASGIVALTVITKPYPCPGHCLYCPAVANMPKSYLPEEPACRRALTLNFNPEQQVQKRIEMLQINGHDTDKIELIILGGTWSFYPKNYRTWFIKKCFEGANKKRSRSLAESQKINERAENRIIGITIETRPDYVNKAEVKDLRRLGVTRVELGVQSIYDDILALNKRGNSVSDIIQATKLLKNAGFKITYHLMLNLLGSDLKRDEEMFQEIFNSPDFQPDQLKIYPCVVLANTELFELYQNKQYLPYSQEDLINLLIRIKENIPPYVRISRIVRDIPDNDIIGSNTLSNLRQIVHERMKKLNKNCQCIRCREPQNTQINFENIKLIRREYQASGGKEIFLSYEDVKNNKILAFLRLRITSEWTLPELKNAALIRELHTYGFMASLKKGVPTNVQHRGLGKKLMAEAERIVKQETNLKKIAVISGVGVRDYYRHLGYRLYKTYLIKTLKK